MIIFDGPGRAGPSTKSDGPGRAGPEKFFGGPGRAGPSTKEDGPGRAGPQKNRPVHISSRYILWLSKICKFIPDPHRNAVDDRFIPL